MKSCCLSQKVTIPISLIKQAERGTRKLRSYHQRNNPNTKRTVCVLSCSVVSDFVRPRGLQPTRLFCPCDSPGKNTGMGCRALLQGILRPRDRRMELTPLTSPALAARSSTTSTTWEALELWFFQWPCMDVRVGP